MQRRARTREHAVIEIVKRYTAARRETLPCATSRLDRREKRELTAAYERNALESFIVWASRHRGTIEKNELLYNDRLKVAQDNLTFKNVHQATPRRFRLI